MAQFRPAVGKGKTWFPLPLGGVVYGRVGLPFSRSRGSDKWVRLLVRTPVGPPSRSWPQLCTTTGSKATTKLQDRTLAWWSPDSTHQKFHKSNPSWAFTQPKEGTQLYLSLSWFIPLSSAASNYVHFPFHSRCVYWFIPTQTIKPAQLEVLI